MHYLSPAQNSLSLFTLFLCLLSLSLSLSLYLSLSLSLSLYSFVPVLRNKIRRYKHICVSLLSHSLCSISLLCLILFMSIFVPKSNGKHIHIHIHLVEYILSLFLSLSLSLCLNLNMNFEYVLSLINNDYEHIQKQSLSNFLQCISTCN